MDARNKLSSIYLITFPFNGKNRLRNTENVFPYIDWEVCFLLSFSVTISFHNRKKKFMIPKKVRPVCFQGVHIYMTDSSSWFQQEFSWTLNISVIQLLSGVAQNPAEPGTKWEQLYINLNCYSINSLGKKAMGSPSQIEQPESWRGIFVSPALLKGQISVQIRRLKH